MPPIIERVEAPALAAGREARAGGSRRLWGRARAICFQTLFLHGGGA